MDSVKKLRTPSKLNGYSTKSPILKDLLMNKYVYLMLLPVVAYYIIFQYLPMYGAVIAFKDFSPGKGILGSDWAGLKHFASFFQGVYFWRLIRNTFVINFYLLIFGFPAPILLAILINELQGRLFKKTVQTISYLPHFISIMVVCGMIRDFVASGGFINQMASIFAAGGSSLLLKPEYFRSIFVISDIWQELGWGSIIYLATLSNIDVQLYEAAIIDGANKFKQILHVTLPGIMPTIVILLILRIGMMMNLGYEKIILLYNPNTYETADVISTFVYRKGLLQFDYSYSAAAGLFNSFISFALLISANWFSKKFNENSLW